MIDDGREQNLQTEFCASNHYQPDWVADKLTKQIGRGFVLANTLVVLAGQNLSQTCLGEVLSCEHFGSVCKHKTLANFLVNLSPIQWMLDTQSEAWRLITQDCSWPSRSLYAGSVRSTLGALFW